MASIRLFGRGKNAAATGGPAVGAALIADVLESLTAASMSTTWRCRHNTGLSIGEGAVDFTAGRSRSTVIRGKYTFEYVRSGASAYRTAVTEVDGDASAKAGALAGAGAGAGAAESDDEDEDVDGLEEVEDEDDVELDEALDAEEDEEAEGEGEDGEIGDEDADADTEIAAEAEDGGDEGDEDEDGEDESDEEDDDSAEGRLASEVTASGVTAAAESSAWERFSEHDACGVHAYAEPAVLAAGVRAAGVVQPREAQEFDGVLLSAYAVTLKPKPGDPNRVLARLARQLRDHGANVVVVTAFVDESQPGSLDGEISLGELNGDGTEPAGEGVGRIVRLRIELPHWTPADDPTADHSVSVDLFEFGEPVSVEVPEGAGRRTARSCADLALF